MARGQMPAWAGIAQLAAMIARRIIDDKDEGKKKKRGKQRETAGRDIQQSVTAPPPPPGGTGILPLSKAELDAMSPDARRIMDPSSVLRGNVYESQALNKILSRQGIPDAQQPAPWEVPGYMAQPGRFSEMERMGVPIDPLFKGMQGEVRTPIGAQEYLDAALPKGKRPPNVRAEALIPSEFGGQIPLAGGGQAYPSSKIQRQGARAKGQEARTKKRATNTEEQQQATLRAAIAAVAKGQPGAPVPPQVSDLIINLGGSEEWARVQAAEEAKLEAATTARDEDEAVQVRAIIDRIRQVGPDKAANLVRMAEAKSEEAGKEANDVVLRMRATAESVRQEAERKATSQLNTIIETGLDGPVSEGLARQYLQLSVASGEDKQKALNGYMWLKEPDPEQREMLFARYAGNEVDFRAQRAFDQRVEQIRRDIDSDELREVGDLMKLLQQMEGDPAAIPSQAMKDEIRLELTERINTRNERRREDAADAGGSDGAVSSTGDMIEGPTATAYTKLHRAGKSVGGGGGGGSGSGGSQQFSYGSVVEFTPPDRLGVTMVGKVSSSPKAGSTERVITVPKGAHFRDEKGNRKVTGETMTWPMDVLELRRSTRPLVIKTLYKSSEDEAKSDIDEAGDALLDSLGL